MDVIRIPLVHSDREVLIDASDLSLVEGRKWRLWCNRYAAEAIYVSSERKVIVTLMHRLLCPDAIQVDHRSGDGLDNRRSNLRSATHSQNMCNRKIHKNNKSGFKGVRFRPDTKRFRASIRVDNHSIHLGHFDDPIAAAQAYDDAAIRLHGEFARLNFQGAAL